MIEPYYQQDGITLYCGDCRDILPQFPDKSFDLVLTDPPYSAGIDRTFNDDIGEITALNLIKGDFILVMFTSPSKVAFVIKTLRYDYLRMVWWYKPNDIAHCWHGFQMVSEAIMIFRNGEAEFPKTKGAIHDTITLCNSKGFHPCQKPLEIIKSLMVRCSNGGIILDPFCGSGTTLVAAKQLGRKAVGIEISEKYCKIAVDRLRQMELFNNEK